MIRLRKLALVFTLAVFPVVSLGSCGGDSHEAIMEDTIDLMNESADILEGITDVASAEAARPKLEKLREKAEALATRTEALDIPDSEMAEKLEKEYAKETEEIGKRMMTTMMRLADKPEVLEALGDAMNTFR